MHVEKMSVEFKCMFKYVCLCWITSMLKKVHVVIKYVQKKCMLICVMFNYLYVEFCYVELFACWIQVCWKMCRSNPLCRSNQTPPSKCLKVKLWSIFTLQLPAVILNAPSYALWKSIFIYVIRRLFKIRPKFR